MSVSSDSTEPLSHCPDILEATVFKAKARRSEDQDQGEPVMLSSFSVDSSSSASVADTATLH